MEPRVTRRIVLGTLIGALVAGPFVMRYLRRGNGLLPDFTAARKAYLAHLSFPREYNPRLHPNINQDDKDVIVQVHKRYWANYAKLRKAEFDYSQRQYLPGGRKSNSFWNMDVRVKMEYGQGFEAKGKDSIGREIDLACRPDGTYVKAAPENAGFSSLMCSFFGAFMAYPETCSCYTEIKQGVEMMPNPYIEGNGLYDVLVMIDAPKDRDPIQTHVKHDYYSRETGMLEFRHVHLPAGNSRGRGTLQGPSQIAADSFMFFKYEPVGSNFLPSMTGSATIPAGGRAEDYFCRWESLYANYANIELWD